VVIGLLWAIVLFGVLASTPFLAANLIAIQALVWLTSKGRLPRRSHLVAVALVWFSVTMAIYYFDPEPLPRATITTASGTIRGDLIAFTDSAWYVASGKNRIRAVPVDKVESSRLETRSNAENEKVFELIFG
jgi:hypothetical protein